MSTGPEGTDATAEEREQALRDLARDRNARMPAETALGNRDPEGGGEGDPKDFEGDGN